MLFNFRGAKDVFRKLIKRLPIYRACIDRIGIGKGLEEPSEGKNKGEVTKSFNSKTEIINKKLGRLCKNCQQRLLNVNVSGLEYKEARNKLLDTAKKYIIAWEKDWAKNPKKAICKELGNKKIIVNDICFNHLEKTGSNTVCLGHTRSLGNLKKNMYSIFCVQKSF